MQRDTSTTASGCIDGLITVPSADGPVHTACLGPCCVTKPAQVRKRYVEPGFTAAMLAAIPSDEEF